MEKLFLGLFVLVSVSQLLACYFENKKWRSINKPFVLITLIGYYLACVSFPNALVVIGLLFGLLGDILLINKKLLKIGAASFLIGHISYSIAFLNNFSLEAIGITSTILIAVIYIAVISLVVFFIQKGHSMATLITNCIYLGVLGFMSFSALLQSMSLGSIGSLLVFIGSLFFMSSDFLLCTREFRKNIKIPKVNLLVMFAYIIAQLLIVLGTIQIT